MGMLPHTFRSADVCDHLAVCSSRRDTVTMPRNRIKSKAKGDEGVVEGSTSIAGVAKEWDEDLTIRERLRSGGSLLHPKTPVKQENIPTIVLNKEVLAPLLNRMCLNPDRILPAMDNLRDEIATFFTMSKREGPDLPAIVEDCAYHLKKFCGFVKTKARRKEVSTVARPNKWKLK